MSRVGWLVLAGCGRIAFDPIADTSDGGDTNTLDGPPGVVAYVKQFAGRHPGGGNTDSFPVQASAAGNFIVLQVDCSTGTAPSTVAVTAPGWSFMQVGSFANTTDGLYAGLFIATAPDTMAATVDVVWASPASCLGKAELGDEFASAGLDAFDNMGGPGNCSGMVTTQRANDAIWCACFVGGGISALGVGFSPAATNNGGDAAEYKLTTDPAGTLEAAGLTNSGTSVASVVAIKPR